MWFLFCLPWLTFAFGITPPFLTRPAMVALDDHHRIRQR
jgi:hypothetical protein